MRKFIIAVAALAFAAGAFAVEVAGVKLDDKATVAGQELVLNGAGVRTKVVFKVYVGSLYLPAKSASGAAVLARRRGESRSTSCVTLPRTSWSMRWSTA